MASAGSKKKVKKVTRYQLVNRTSALLSLVLFGVVILGGIMSDVRFITIAYRGALAIVGVGLATRVLIKSLGSFEEMRSGQS